MKVLIIKLSSIGDLVHSIPAYQALKKALAKEASVDWLVYENLSDVLSKSINQENLIKLKDKKLTTLIKTATKLKGEYDYVIDLQGLFKTALMSKLIAPETNYGFKMPREDWAKYFYRQGFCDYKSIETKKHVVEQNLELVASFAKEVLDLELDQKIDFNLAYSKRAMANSKKSLCLIPATTWESKHWQKSNWNELISGLENEYEVFMTGSEKDLDYLQDLAAEHKVNFITQKKLCELFDFYQNMDLIIGVDTGPLHIAAAALYKERDKKKIVGIYGPSSASRSGPYGFKAISADELLGTKASNKKSYAQDKDSIASIKVENLLKLIKQDCTLAL